MGRSRIPAGQFYLKTVHTATPRETRGRAMARRTGRALRAMRERMSRTVVPSLPCPAARKVNETRCR